MNNFFVKYKSPVAAVLFLILLGGIYCLNTIKTGLFPDITFPKIKIIAENGEQPVDKMMVTVTVPVENAVKRVEELKLIRSTTTRGSCEISAFLNWGADADLGKQRVEAQINAIRQNLPDGVAITIEKMNPSILAVMGFSLEGDGRSPIELRQLAEFTVKPMLSRIAGIAEVAVIGGKVKEYRIVLDPLKMSNRRVTPATIANVLSQTNFITSNGFLTDANRLYLTLTDAAIDGKTELLNTVIVNSARSKIRVRDFARVEIAERRDFVKINANGKNVPLIAVMKQPGANLLDVTAAVNRRLGEIHRILPKDVNLRPYYNQADFVGDSIRSLRDVLWIGLILAMLVAILFLRSFRASAVILVTIPVTLSLTLIVLRSLGYTFNIMTIGAIAAAIGLIIDDAIIVVEQIHRTHEEHPDEKSVTLVAKALRFLLPAMVGSSLSTIVIFLPFVLMGGVAGAYFKVMTDTMIITLCCSFLVVWLGLPVVTLLLSSENRSVQAPPKSFNRGGWVRAFLRKPWIAAGFILVLVLAAGFLLPRLPSGFLPEMDEGSIVLDYWSPPGSSLEATDGMLKVVDGILQRMPQVESFSRRTGSQMGFFITEPNTGDYLIQLKKRRDKTTDETADVIRAKIEAALPSFRADFGQVVGDQLGDLIASAQPIEVKIFGNDHDRLIALADSAASIIEGIRGTADVFNGVVIAGPTVTFEPKIANLAQYHLTPGDFQFQMQTKIEGSVVGGILEKDRVVDVRMQEEGTGSSLHNLKRGFLFLNDGRMKPISEFADLKVTGGVAEIDRENLKPMVAVTARLDKRDLGSTLREIREKIGSRIVLPQGYEIVYGGAYSEQQQAFRELTSILIAAVLLVFTVILFLFKSLKASLAIIGIAVLGISGCVLALFAASMPLNVGSYTGIIMIVGIIGENAIFTYLQYQEGRKNRLNVEDALVYSISTRLRPKLMTALGAISALAPLALGMGAGAQMHQPLAVAIIGGLAVALPLLLIVLPTVLRMIEK